MVAFNGTVAADECLVYVPQRDVLTGIGGATLLAKIIRTYEDNNVVWYDLRVLGRPDGRMDNDDVITVSSDMIISLRVPTDINPKVFYHDSPDDFLHATNFVIKSNKNNPLASTSRTALGTGIFGLTTPTRAVEGVGIPAPTRPGTLFSIPADNPFIVQDLAHSESITLASLNTNRYVDLVLEHLTEHDHSEDKIRALLSDQDLERLTTLWNLVLARGLYKSYLTEALLGKLLAEYIFDYLQPSVYEALPINRIMMFLEYTELLTNNNTWDRGCVSFVITDPARTVLEGGVARY